MTLLGEKLKSAGVNTADARLMALAVGALRECGGSAHEAATILWEKLKAESWVAREVWLLPYLLERQNDMKGRTQEVSPSWRETPATSRNQAAVEEPSRAAPKPATPAPSPAVKAKVSSIVERAVRHLRFGHLTSDGKDWADVGAHELDGMERDGALAGAVKSKLGVLTNSDRFKSLGELLSPKLFNEARDEVLK